MAQRFLRPWRPVVATAAMVMASGSRRFYGDQGPAISFTGPSYNWNGFYAGGHLGVAWGSSHWTTPNGNSGALDLFQPIDTFDEAGSFFEGAQVGYNYMLADRILLGAQVDATFPSFKISQAFPSAAPQTLRRRRSAR